ncbi:MAG: hypothetical protein F6K32_22195, partial [Desertifilum sp. SIO1I2]|nr:hypothetical protein [Desertifilum sp. SIO1I2]
MYPYVDFWLSRGFKLHSISRHMLQLFAGQPGTKAWKRYLSDRACLPGANSETLRHALAQIPLSVEMGRVL